MASIDVRDARPEEYDEVGEATVSGYGADDSMAEYRAVLRDVATRSKSADIIVATLDATIVGAAAYPHKGGDYEDIAFAPHEAEFRMLTTTPAGRGLGIGELLSRECIRRARRDGRTHVVISVAPGNAPAERIYQRLGFIRDPQRDWNASDGFALQCWDLDLVKYCGVCGQDAAAAHGHRGVELEPDRFCRYCARRLQVQIMPSGSETKPCLCTTER